MTADPSTQTSRSVKLTLNVPRGILLNSNQRLHWAAKSKRTKALRAMTHAVARHPRNRTRFSKPVAIHTLVKWPDGRRRDAHNLDTKPIIDGIVDAGIIPDDSDKWVRSTDIAPSDERCDKRYACTLVITIWEV